MYCAIVVLYEPDSSTIKNILNYYNSVEWVYILDNSDKSCKESIQNIIPTKDEHYTYHWFGKNIGLASALNYGMNEARQDGYKWALMMDSDSTLANNILIEYENYLTNNQNEKIAVLAPVHLFDRSNNCIYNGTQTKVWTMTSGCLFNINIFFKVEGFNEDLFVDGLDIDYGYRATRAGFEIIEIGSAGLNHHPGKSRELKIGNITIFKYGIAEPKRYFMQAKALIYIGLKYKSPKILFIYLYKWAKAILLFDHKHQYCLALSKGSKEGYDLYRSGSKIKSV